MDTETLPGKPYTYQQALSTGTRELVYVDGIAPMIRAKFYALLDAVPSGQYALGAFYFFRFDIQTVFFDKPEHWRGSASLDAVDVDNNGVFWTGALTWPTVFLVLQKDKKKLILIDLFRFWEGGLARCCEKLELPIRKLSRPACVTENREPSKAERAEFEEYALIDSEAALSLLGLLDSLWEMDNNPPSFSNAHESGRVFKIRYAPGGLDRPDDSALRAGEWAYHGGRNSLDIPTVPCIIPNCTLWDVSSQYPAVCVYDLPAFYKGEWIWRDNHPLDPNGIYQILEGDLTPLSETLPDFLMDSGGRYFRRGPGESCLGRKGKTCKIHHHGSPRHSWFTGVELITAVNARILKLFSWWGFSWVGDSSFSPLKSYMLDHYREKDANRGNEVLYQRSKYRLNTLTGKFIATIPRGRFLDNGSFQEWRLPGGLYNPPVGALITGHARAQIFKEELRLDVFHAATDSIVVPNGQSPISRAAGLGAWEKQVSGDFLVGRNKLYAFISPAKDGSFTGAVCACGTQFPQGKSRQCCGKKQTLYFKGREILKYARHGFQGDILDFIAAAFSGAKSLDYTYNHMGGIRESRKIKEVKALVMNKRDATVKFGGKYFG